MFESETVGRALTMHNDAHKRVYDYWNALRNGRPAPQRLEIDPSALRDVLASTLILEHQAKNHPIFRIAGTSICAAFGRELRDHNFTSLWDEPGRPQILTLIDAITSKGRAGIARFSAATLDKTSYRGELLLLPVADGEGGLTRLIGSFHLDRGLDILGFRKLVKLHLDQAESFDPAIDHLMVELQEPPAAQMRPLAVVKTNPGLSQGQAQSRTPWSERLASLLEPTRD